MVLFCRLAFADSNGIYFLNFFARILKLFCRKYLNKGPIFIKIKLKTLNYSETSDFEALPYRTVTGKNEPLPLPVNLTIYHFKKACI